MRRLTILVACWKRHALTSLMLQHTQRVASEVMAGMVNDDEIEIRAIVSPEEDYESRALVSGLGIPYVNAPNSPLSGKWNKGMADLEGHTGAVMILGSDDFITAPALKAAFEAVFHRAIDLFGFSTFFFLGAGPRAAIWSGYAPETGRAGEPMGAGRCFSAHLLDILKWKPWPDGLRSGLDGACWKRVLAAKEFLDVEIRTVPLVSTGGVCVDVKAPGGENVCDFQSYIETGEEIDWRQVTRHFSADLVEAWNLDPEPLYRSRVMEESAKVPAKVALVMIARDAEESIERAVRGAMPIIGEFVLVLDDRTTDRTEEIANTLCAAIYSRPWQGFAAQRNTAHALAHAEWHLVVDADETIDLGDIADCIYRAEKEDSDVIFVNLHARVASGVVPQLQPRVIRKGCAQWRYRCHNDLVNARAGKGIVSTAIIRQDYRGKLNERAARAIPVLLDMYANPTETGVPEGAERLHAANFLSQAYLGLGDWPNVEKWATIVRDTDHEGKYPEAWARLCCAKAMRDVAEGEAELRLAIAKHPEFGEFHHMLGGIHLAHWFINVMQPGRYATRPQPSAAFVGNYVRATAALGVTVQVRMTEVPQP